MSSSGYQTFEIHNTDITYLKGVGPKRGATLKKNGFSSIGQILRYYPRRYLDRTNVKLIWNLPYHPQFNGIELYWAKLKFEFRKRLTDMKIREEILHVEELIREIQ